MDGTGQHPQSTVGWKNLQGIILAEPLDMKLSVSNRVLQQKPENQFITSTLMIQELTLQRDVVAWRDFPKHWRKNGANLWTVVGPSGFYRSTNSSWNILRHPTEWRLGFSWSAPHRPCTYFSCIRLIERNMTAPLNSDVTLRRQLRFGLLSAVVSVHARIAVA